MKPEEVAALKKLLINQATACYKSLENVSPDAADSLLKQMNSSDFTYLLEAAEDVNLKNKLPNEREQILDTVDQKVESLVEKFVNDNRDLKESYEKNQIEKNAQAASQRIRPFSETFLDYMKTIVSLLSLIGTLVGLGLLINFLLNYCNAHSGCMLVQATTDSNQTKNKQQCPTGIISGTKGLTYGATNCVCSDTPPPQKAATSSDWCEKDNLKVIHHPDMYKPNVQCKGQIGVPPFTYYSYQIMTPFDAIPNIMPSFPSLNEVTHFVIIIAVSIGTILLIFLLSKFIRPKNKT